MSLATTVSSPHSFRVELALEVFRKLYPSHAVTITSHGVLKACKDDTDLADAAARTAFAWADAFIALTEEQ